MMSAVPRRMLPLVGLSLVLLAVVGGSAARVESRKSKAEIHAHASAATLPAAVPNVGGGGTGVSGTSHGATAGPPTPRPPTPVPLTEGWRYLADPHNLGVAEDWGSGGDTNLAWTVVSMPNDFNRAISSASDIGAVGWYELKFTGPPISAGRSWNVSFESVRRNAEVWLNGYKIGSNSDPYAPFSLPATTLMPRATNTLIVRVDNFRGGSLPEDWWNWGGIMGPVTLEPAGRISLKQLGVTPELGCNYRCGHLLVQGTLENNGASSIRPDIVVRVSSPGGDTSTVSEQAPSIRARGSTPVSFRVQVPRPVALWSPENPELYQVHVQTTAQQRVAQDDTLRVGMRSVQVHGGILYLNGRRLWLRGAAIHEDIYGRGAALSDGDIDTIVSELRSVGANITRAHYLLSPRLLDALDAAGIMVWAQPPVDHADVALRTAGGRARALAMLKSTLIGDRNHPSVIINSVGNELSPIPDKTPGTLSYLEQAIPLAQRLSPGIAVGLDTYCYPGFPAQRIYSKLNVIGISSYFGWYSGQSGHSTADFNELEPFLRQSRARYPQQALAVSEFGAEALFDGPAATKGSYQFQSNYLTQTFGVLDRLPFMNGAIYWTLREFAEGPGWTGGATLPPGGTPDGLHHKGLIAYDGTAKPAFAVAQQAFAAMPGFVR